MSDQDRTAIDRVYLWLRENIEWSGNIQIWIVCSQYEVNRINAMDGPNFNMDFDFKSKILNLKSRLEVRLDPMTTNVTAQNSNTNYTFDTVIQFNRPN
jgi:hypothetical protein